MENQLTHTQNLITALNAVYEILTDGERANRVLELINSINVLNSMCKSNACETSYCEYYLDCDYNDDFILEFRTISA